MTEKRFQYIRGKYSHGVHDTVKDGEYKKGYRTTYDEFDLDKLTDELNVRENKIKQLEKENEQLKKENKQLKSEIRYFQSKLHNNTMEVRELTLGEVKESIRKLERWE